MLGADYLRLVLSRWRLVTGLVIGCTLLAWLISVLILAQNPKFEAAARLNIVPTSEELGYANRFVRGSTFDGGSTLLQTYAEFAHTRPVVAPIVDRFIAEQAKAAGQSQQAWIAANNLGPSLFSPSRLLSILNYGAAPVVPLRQDVIDGLIKHTNIETVEGTYLLRITVEWDDPKQAAWFANALADAIIARAETMSAKSGTEIAGSLEDRLAAKQAELATALRRSRDMKAAAGVVDVDRQKQSLLEAQIAEQSQLTSDRATLQANQSQVAGLKRQTGGKLSTAQAAIEETLAVEGPKAAGLARGISIREGRVAQIKGQITALGKQEDAIRALDDQATQLRTEVAALTERVSFSQTENLANAPRIQLIERAVPPLVRSSPKTLFNSALGFIAGCALAGCALLLLGEAPARVREDAEAEEEAPLHDVEPTLVDPVARVRSARPIDPPAEPVPDVSPRVVEIPRPLPAPTAPVFATAGSLAFAVDAEPEEVAEDELVLTDAIEQPVVEKVPSEPVVEAVEEAETPAPGSAPIAEIAASGPVTLADRVFGYVLPPPRRGSRYEQVETLGIGRQVADWLGAVLADGRPLTVAATGEEADAQRVYQLIHDYRAATGAPVLVVDWSEGARAFPRGDGKPLIYAGGSFGKGPCLAHRDGAVVVAIGAADALFEDLEAEARRLSIIACRPVHVLALGG